MGETLLRHFDLTRERRLLTGLNLQADKLRQSLTDLTGSTGAPTFPSMPSNHESVDLQSLPVKLLSEEPLSVSSRQLNPETLTKGLGDTDPSLIDPCSQAILTNVPSRETQLFHDLGKNAGVIFKEAVNILMTDFILEDIPQQVGWPSKLPLKCSLCKEDHSPKDGPRASYHNQLSRQAAEKVILSHQ